MHSCLQKVHYYHFSLISRITLLCRAKRLSRSSNHYMGFEATTYLRSPHQFLVFLEQTNKMDHFLQELIIASQAEKGL